MLLKYGKAFEVALLRAKAQWADATSAGEERVTPTMGGGSRPEE